jgi:hypothetical protein
MMMQESLIGEFCRPSLDQRRTPAALPGTVGALSVGTFASVLQHGLPAWVSPDVPVTGRVTRRAETRQIASNGAPADRGCPSGCGAGAPVRDK